MKKNKLIAAAIALLIALQGVAYAETPSIEANQVPLTDTVNVKIINARPNTLISVRITNSRGEKDFYEMGYVNADGSFEFSYINDRNSGDMYVEAQVDGEKITGSYFKMGDEIYNEFIYAVNTQHELQGEGELDGDAIKAVFDKYEDKFTFERTAYDRFSESQKKNVYDTMANDSSFKGEINDFKSVLNAFYAAVLLECYNENPKSLKNMAQVSPYKEVIEAPGTAPVLVKSIGTASNSVLDEVFPNVSQDVDNIKKLLQDIELQIFKTTIANAGTWNDVKTAFTQYKNILGINPDDADMNDYKALIGRKYSTYSEYANAFKAQIKPDNNQQAGGGGNDTGSEFIGTVKPLPGSDNGVDTEKNEKDGNLVFSDLTEAMWAIKAVTLVHERGIIAGVGDGKFEPNRTITRAEAVRIITAMMGDEDGVSIPFEDVSESDWFYKCVSIAYKHGIVNGVTETIFDPYSLVTRQEMAVMVYNSLKDAMGDNADTLNPNIVDKDLIAPWAVDAVTYLYAKNIIVGRVGNLFDPTDNMTRAEAATVIYNIIKQ